MERAGRTNFTKRKHVIVYVGNTLQEKAASLADVFHFFYLTQLLNKIQ